MKDIKESEVKKMYNSITNIKDEFTEEALTVRLKRKNYGWVKWCAVAACLCLAVGMFFMSKVPKAPKVEMKALKNLDEITASYDGNLLAEKLVASGARTTGINLSYVKGGDVSDPGTWNTLSVTGDYNGQDFTLDCDFDSKEDTKDPVEVYAETQYGDVKVVIYREKSDWGENRPYIYRAKFTLDGVTYDLSTHSSDPENIYFYLDMVFGKPEDDAVQSEIILTDVLGFDVCRVEMEEVSPYQYIWHYYVELDGEDVCVGEQFGYDDYPQAWSRDVDGDGVPELICNCTYGDGLECTYVYRNNNGIIEEGSIRVSYYEEKYGWTEIGMGGISSYPVELYDPDRNVFTATDYYTNGYNNPVTVEFDDLEPFTFTPFKHMP